MPEKYKQPFHGTAAGTVLVAGTRGWQTHPSWPMETAGEPREEPLERNQPRGQSLAGKPDPSM
ncbi:MAG: hypothetical protein ACOX1X_03575 [Dethiobacteria bacterium]